MRTDRQTDTTKLIVAFRTFANALKNRLVGWRRLLNKQLLLDYYTSPNIIGVTKFRRMIRQGHVARIRGEQKYISKIFVGKPEEKRPI
jgi:hypothetical protein